MTDEPEGCLPALIGGSGFSDDWLSRAHVIKGSDETPYGRASSPVCEIEIGGSKVLFLLRHGKGHSYPPQAVPYAANLFALRAAGATEIVAFATVGGVAKDMAPGVLCVPDDLIDRTWGRQCTLYTDEETGVQHVDFTHPFDESLRKRLLGAAKAAGLKGVVDGGLYWCSEGPRLETAAEVRLISFLGGTMVGMTAASEAAVARELGIPYALVALSVNWAAGLGDSESEVSLTGMKDVNKRLAGDVRRLMTAMFSTGKA